MRRVTWVGKAAVAIGGVAMVLGLVRPAAAQGRLDLGVGASQALYYPGDQLRLSVSAQNVAGTGAADFYTGLLLPDGVTVATLGGGAVRLGTLANPAAFLPAATGVSLASPFSVAVDPLFAYVWTGAEPLGSYTIFLVAVRAGGFADNRIDAGDVLALQTGGLNLRARGQIAVNEAATVSADITPETGGSVVVAGTGGATFTLALPPGAVEVPTTITATPITSATGLPLDRVIGAVRFGPDGLVLHEPATLTMTVPASVRPLGTVGFAMKDDGTGFETVPVTVASGVATMRIGHFSSSGFGQSVCGPTVTTAVGRDACREMAERLAEAAAIIAAGSGGTPLPVRVLLAAELRTELEGWLEGIKDQVDIQVVDDVATMHYLFIVGLREIDAIKAILELVTALDIGAVSLPRLSALDQAVPSTIDLLRTQENTQCLANKSAYRDWLRRLFELAGESRERGLLLSGNTHGITCVRLETSVSLAAIVPPAGAPLTGVASVQFSDGAPLPDAPVVTIEIKTDGQAVVPNPTFAQGPNQATLTTLVAPVSETASSLRFIVLSEVPEIGLSRQRSVVRGQSVSGITRRIDGRVRAEADGDIFVENGTQTSRLGLRADRDRGDASALAEASGVIELFTQNTQWRLQGVVRASTDPGPGSATASTTIMLGADVVGSFTCRVVVTTETLVDAEAVPPLLVRMTRAGTTVFQATGTADQTLACPDGHYEVEVTTSAASSKGVGGDGFATRLHDVVVTLTPVESDAVTTPRR